MPAADPGTGHYPATVTRSGGGKKPPTITSSCSCGWTAPAANHDHSIRLFTDHHVELTGKQPPAPTAPTRRTR